MSQAYEPHWAAMEPLAPRKITLVEIRLRHDIMEQHVIGGSFAPFSANLNLFQKYKKHIMVNKTTSRESRGEINNLSTNNSGSSWLHRSYLWVPAVRPNTLLNCCRNDRPCRFLCLALSSSCGDALGSIGRDIDIKLGNNMLVGRLGCRFSICGSLSYDIAVEIVEIASRTISKCYAHKPNDRLPLSERS